MVAQTTYEINTEQALAGMLADIHNHDIDSFSVETALGADFGIAVSRGTDAERQIVIGGATNFVGITVRTLDIEGAINTGLIKLQKDDTAAVLSEGYIFVVCPTGCVPDDLVNYVEATGVIDSGAAVGVGETTLDGAKWQTTTAAGELGIIKIDNRNVTPGV